MGFYIARVGLCARMRKELKARKYKMRPTAKVIVYRPKFRIANAPWFRDRVWQRSMCNNGVYADLTRGFILNNICCQKGKGQDMAIRHVIGFLQALHRKSPGAPVYGVHLDIRKFFPSTPHALVEKMEREKITEPEYLPFLNEIIYSVKDERPEEVIATDPFGERGTGLGSQINQLNQIALLDDIDHAVITICPHYIRYNDDFLILDHDRERIVQAKALIRDRLIKKGLTLTDKGGVFTADRGFYFLRKRFILRGSGKIILRLHPKALSDERGQLRDLHHLVRKGEKTMEDVRMHYQSWIAHAEYAGDAPIWAMDRYYSNLFRQRPEYKRKEKYLYGKNCAQRERTRPETGSGKPDAEGRTGEGQRYR